MPLALMMGALIVFGFLVTNDVTSAAVAAPTPAPRWLIREVGEYEEASALAAAGWEPYAVCWDPRSNLRTRYYLRARAQ